MTFDILMGREKDLKELSEDLETLKLCQHFENIREDFDTMMESCIGGLYK